MTTRRSLHPATHHAPVGRHIELDGGTAFVPDFRRGFVASRDGDAEAFGEEFITAATSAEAVGETARDEIFADELSGLSIDADDDDTSEL